MPSLLTLRHDDAVVDLAPTTGGAIARFDWRGAPVLRATPSDAIADGDVRRHACYPLVPYSNRIERGRLAFRGTMHQLDRNFGDHPHAIHGVGWQRPWDVLDHDETSALLASEHEPRRSGTGDANARAWPWPFRATQWLQLGGDDTNAVLRMRLTLTNRGDGPFPFGLGWHPFFPGSPDTTLGFGAKGVWETDDTILPVRHAAVAGKFLFDPPRGIANLFLDNVYTGWQGAAELRHPAAARVTTLRGDTACPYFVVYVPPHGTFLAIEPVTQMTDAFNRAERGERDTGTRVLGAGESFSCTMEISVRAAA